MTWYNFGSVKFKKEKDGRLFYSPSYCANKNICESIIEVHGIALWETHLIVGFDLKIKPEEISKYFDKDLNIDFTVEFATFASKLQSADNKLVLFIQDTDKENKKLLSELYNHVLNNLTLYQDYEVYF